MPGMYKYSMEIESNVKKLLLDTKELQDRMDTLEGKEYKINLYEACKNKLSEIPISQFAEDVEFIPLETTDDCLIGDACIVSSITQKDILTIERGLYIVNKDKKRREIVPKQNKNTSIENGPLVSKILSILAEKPLIDKIELCNIINERTPNLQLSESGLVNILSHLKKGKKITCTKGLYKINNDQEKTQRKKRTIKNNTKSGNSEC